MASAVVDDACLTGGTVVMVAADVMSFTLTACDWVGAAYRAA